MSNETSAISDVPTFSEVPSKIDFPALENRILRFWSDHRSFEKLVEQNRGKPKWSFLDGPMTANNPMGVHHAWGRSYKDMFCRYHAMLGQELRYQNGFDCQGLWVEVEVEKELGFKSKRDIEAFGVADFVNRCKERVKKFAAIQTQQSMRLGYWMDWNDSYYTMSEENNYTIWAFLKKCHENGWVYKGTDVMPWCGRCGTGLSQHEIATEGYRELTHVSPFFRMPLVDRPGESLLVWTTTPWTLTSNVACAVHPDYTYLKVRQGDEIYYIVEARESVLKEKGPYKVEDRIPGSKMIGWVYQGPFDELPAQAGIVHRVIPWAEITQSEGTGIVHIAPGCGKEDFELSKIHGLRVIAPLDEVGAFLPGFEPYTGKDAGTVFTEILDALKAKDLLYKKENYSHSYPVCWRCGQELLFRLVEEWFIRMGDKLDRPVEQITAEEKRANLRYQIIDVIREARWIPSYGYDRELDWLKNMHDWMISKKRYWGLALPIFECRSCHSFEVIGGKDELKSRAIAGWNDFEGHSPHRPWIDSVKIACPKCGKETSRIKDVGNPWLDAGIVAFSTMRYSTDRSYWEKWFPADMITESFPGQFRNWFYSLLAMSTVMAGKSPFKCLFGYALMRAQDGREMHKSWGNAIEFNEAAEKAGVDAMRWLFASHIPENNLLFGYETIDEARREFLTLWNVYSFFVTYARVDGFDPHKPALTLADRSVFDRWILGSLENLVEEAHRGFSDYQIHFFMRHAKRFIEELSTWYVRRCRRRFWKTEDDRDKLAAYQTLHEVLVTLCKVMAPILPFVTEEMYQNLVRSWDHEAHESVHHCTFPTARPERVDAGLNATMDKVLEVVELARMARQKAQIKIRQPLARMLIKLPENAKTADFTPFESHIRDELNVKELEYKSDFGDLVKVLAKLDAKKAGPRLGKTMQAALGAFKKLTSDEISSGLAKGRLTVEVGGAPMEILPEEVVVERVAASGFSLGESKDAAVLISTEITPELRQEGMVRDLIRHVQELRKDSRLDVADRIRLVIGAGDDTKAAVRANLEMLSRETLSTQVLFDTPTGSHVTQLRLDGELIDIGLDRAS